MTIQYSYIISHFSYTATLFLFNLGAAKILGPSRWGEISIVLLYFQYLPLLTFGLFNGMGLRIPIINIRGNNPLSKHIVGSTILIIFVLFIVLMVPIIYLLFKYLYDFTTSEIIIVIVVYCIYLLFVTLKMVMRSLSAFNLFAASNILLSILLVVGIVLVHYGFDYFIVFASVIMITEIFIFIRIRDQSKYSIKYSLEHRTYFKKLIQIGFPVLMVGILYEFMLTIDKVLLTMMVSTSELGIYSLASMIFRGCFILGIAMSTYYIPDIIKCHGARDYSEMIRLSKHLQKISVIFIILVSVVISIFYKYVISNYMPEYSLIKYPLIIMLVSAAIMPLALYGNILNIISRQKVYFQSLIISTFINGILTYILLANGYGINGAAISLLCSILFFVSYLRYYGKIIFNKLISDNEKRFSV